MAKTYPMVFWKVAWGFIDCAGGMRFALTPNGGMHVWESAQQKRSREMFWFSHLWCDRSRDRLFRANNTYIRFDYQSQSVAEVWWVVVNMRNWLSSTHVLQSIAKPYILTEAMCENLEFLWFHHQQLQLVSCRKGGSMIRITSISLHWRPGWITAGTLLIHCNFDRRRIKWTLCIPPIVISNRPL